MDVCGVMEMDSASQFQILDEAVYILHSTNTPDEGMNPTILHPAMAK